MAAFSGGMFCSRFARDFFFLGENYGNPGVTLINFYAMWVWEI